MSNYIITMGLNLYVFAKGRLAAILMDKCPYKITLRVCQDTLCTSTVFCRITGLLSIYICKFAIPHTLYPITQFQIL